MDKINEFLCQCPKGEATYLRQDLCPLDLFPDYFREEFTFRVDQDVFRPPSKVKLHLSEQWALSPH